MSENQKKPGRSGTAIKLFLLILALLAVPIVMDQVEVDRENVRLVGRIAAGATGLLFLYGVFSKVMKVMGFVVIVLIALVVLVAEGALQAPRVAQLFGKTTSTKSTK